MGTEFESELEFIFLTYIALDPTVTPTSRQVFLPQRGYLSSILTNSINMDFGSFIWDVSSL